MLPIGLRQNIGRLISRKYSRSRSSAFAEHNPRVAKLVESFGLSGQTETLDEFRYQKSNVDKA